MKGSRTILITGATAGIGRHAALHLARKGHRVFATGRRQAALDTLREEAAGTRLETLTLDVTDERSVTALAAEIDKRTDGYGVDVLVNNAGYGCFGPLEEIADADLRRQYDTNVFGLMAVTRAFLPKMRERGYGRVINVSSVGGRMTFPFMGAYNSTKYAIESLSDALRREVARFGVRVVLIEPGVIKTEFADRALDLVGGPAPTSPYADVYARSLEFNELFQRTAVGPEHTTRAIERAIEARWPKARYVAPYRVKFVLALVALLPTRWTDALIGTLTRGSPSRGGPQRPTPPSTNERRTATELSAN